MKELFIVEGESAASTVRQAMYKPDQSVLALQGKLINTATTSISKVLSDSICQRIFQALGCGINEHCDAGDLLFSKILILMDPDVDGTHARMLTITLFENYLKPLIDSGVVWVVIPPSFRITASNHCYYAWNDRQQKQILNQITQKTNITISRVKSVAQFSTAECRQHLLQPDTRVQINLVSSPTDASPEMTSASTHVI
ncbi:MAG TPA: hypothetical protein ENJ32_11465 [Crenotrichaceae bacterium]|nr:hypothetical protein [Crenotrichaceae bacterium]